MRRIQIELGPPPRSYRAFADAVSGAEQHPLQHRARDAGVLLDGAEVVAAKWSNDACDINFTNGLVLRVKARDFQLEWQVRTTDSQLTELAYDPVELIWNPELETVFDPCSLLARISGAKFANLFINEMGLLLYTSGNPILWFHAYRNRESSADFLFATFED